MVYLLGQMYVQEPAGGIISDDAPWVPLMNPARAAKNGGWIGYANLVQALDQNIIYNLTAPPGSWTSLYYGLMGQLGNWEFNVKKVDESVEVSPMYKGFYEMVMNEKQNIEIKVKKVIDDIISHTSELELILHDIRRYKEFYDYFDYSNSEEKRKPDEHSLKAVFIDMVDYHSGEGTPGRLSMSFMQQNNIFPTIIQDFYQMNSIDDIKTNPRLSGLANVEKDMLKTKYKAYTDWKSLFGNEVRKRYERLKQLADSKEAMINKSREWIKPYIARHKLLKEGMSDESARTDRLLSEFNLNVQPTSATSITVWAWKEFPIQEFFKTPGELMSPTLKEEARFIEKSDGGKFKGKYILKDRWTMDNLIMDKKLGLKERYDFINEDWVQEKVNDIMFNDDWFRARKRIANKTYYYYAFMEIRFDIWTTRTSTGVEIEDTNVSIRSFWMSRNVLLTKLLELKAMQKTFEDDIKKMLGETVPSMGEKPDEKKAKKSSGLADIFKPVQDFLKFFGIENFRFSRILSGYGPPPYETSFKNRISKFYLVALGRFYFGPISKYVRAGMMK